MGLPLHFCPYSTGTYDALWTKKEDLAAVSVANYNYAATNPVAQMQKTLTLDEAMNAPTVDHADII
jgi:acetyl-CoA C-acetyltransferase